MLPAPEKTQPPEERPYQERGRAVGEIYLGLKDTAWGPDSWELTVAARVPTVTGVV